MQKRIEETNLSKFGVKYFSQHESYASKVKKTKKERYGDENYNNLDKAIKTKLEKYGDENYTNIKKAKETNLEKYGVDNPSKSKIIINKIKEVNNVKFGFNSPTQNKEIKDKIKQKAIIKLKEKYDFIIKINESSIDCKCNKCNEVFNIPRVLLNERYREGYELCTKCNPIGSSSTSIYEQELIDYIKSLNENIQIITRDKTILEGKELDIYLSEFKLAFEINGLYWHCEKFKNSDYHLNKTLECEKKEIKLIHIFEDELIHKMDIVKSRIKNMLGLNEYKIFARKCIIKEITTSTSNDFLNNNHIQGKSKSIVKLGLFYNNELVSVMTFDKGRIIMSGKDFVIN